MTERQVDDLRVQFPLVRDHEVERADDIARPALAGSVENLDDHQSDVRRDALEIVVREHAAAGNQRAMCVPWP